MLIMNIEYAILGSSWIVSGLSEQIGDINMERSTIGMIEESIGTTRDMFENTTMNLFEFRLVAGVLYPRQAVFSHLFL